LTGTVEGHGLDLLVSLDGRAAGEAPIVSAPPTPTRDRIPKNWKPVDGYSIYEARTAAADLAFCVTAAIRVFAAEPEECGFCPVISWPSLTT
jgi:hypothetical protein